MAHCGFPEISYSKYVSVLADRGYRVCRIEQTETPEQVSLSALPTALAVGTEGRSHRRPRPAPARRARRSSAKSSAW